MENTIANMNPAATDAYWKILTRVAETGYHRVVAPAVSRHFDFLRKLSDDDSLPVDENRLRRAMEKVAGYYVGRPHPPYTEVRIVKSIDRNKAGFMEDVPPGRPGYLIVRGGNVMKGYVGDPAATRAVFEKGWYLGGITG